MFSRCLDGFRSKNVSPLNYLPTSKNIINYSFQIEKTLVLILQVYEKII